MLVGLIGPQSSIDILTRNKTNLPIEFLPLPYKTFKQAVEMVKANEKLCDAMLFTGQTPYTYVSGFLHPNTPWEYLPRNQLSTMCALLKAGLIYGNLKNISMDGFSKELMETIRTELQTSSTSLHFYNVNFDIFAPDYIQQVIDYHMDNYREGRADLCFTGSQEIYELLIQKGIPTIKTNPNFSLLTQKLELLLLKYKVFHNEKNLPAVVTLRPSFQLDHNPYGQNELQLVRLKAALAENIYYYAQTLNAAVFTSSDQYYMFCNADTLEAETHHFSSINNLCHNNIDHPLLEKLAIGIGIGYTMLTAKYASEQALMHAKKNDNSCCYVLDEKKHLYGPVQLKDALLQPETKTSNLEAISRQTNLGLPTLQKLEQVIRQYKVKNVTATELAFYCSMPLRSMNRLLQRLEDHGYVTIVGKEPQPNSGRPRRVLRINLTFNE